MPFKLHSKDRRHIPRQRHRVTNWREYDASLCNRGSLTIRFGDTLKSRHDTRRATEVAIAIKSLNRMNQLGRAIFTRIA